VRFLDEFEIKTHERKHPRFLTCVSTLSRSTPTINNYE
jgi:hypothetical protein